ncbi:Splicing factor U2AF subunit [Sesamum alatum]|uniref:Splicing factor U2AF subunit n=1 Tax=Sesamum alatum TaxID=300844 RepID=A0AAE1YCY5_9LAMI|nr:Splicing factor U2AF subunit [Sesamum alatum]
MRKALWRGGKDKRIFNKRVEPSFRRSKYLLVSRSYLSVHTLHISFFCQYSPAKLVTTRPHLRRIIVFELSISFIVTSCEQSALYQTGSLEPKKHKYIIMSRSHSHKGKSGSTTELKQDDFLEGTSARTRPYSFDDIMLTRKNRGDATKQVASGPGVADITHDEKPLNSPECHRQVNEDSGSMDIRQNSNDPQKLNSRKKGDINASRKHEKLVQDKDKGSRNPGVKLKSIVAKNVSSNRVSEGKDERRHHSNRNKDGGLLGDDSDNGSDKRPVRDSVKKDGGSERSREKSKIDRKQLHNEDKQVSRKRKTDGRMSSDSENEYKRRNARDVMHTDKLPDRGRDKPEKENRHKHHNEEDKTRGRHTGKKHDSEKKGLESARGYLEESRSKRRRSRSREHAKERGRRSASNSPKAHKSTTKDKKEHGEVLSHSMKDRAGREHSDVEKKRIASNGSSQYRRNAGTSSGLGGYSPRKRKTDAAAKTPSPTHRSPERRTAGWDLQPVEKVSTTAAPTLSNIPATSQSLSLNIKEFFSGAPLTPTVVKPTGISHHTLSSQMHAIESVQLTQATRPMRRLYVDNLPASASEKDLIECINNFLLSSGVNYIHGTQPCISCIIHKEKGQALLEFLTPEDASAALSSDGISFSGSKLKLRRPKDYSNVTTGLPDKSVVAVDSISGNVEDSPHKIFIAGISKLISSKMLLEIARAFGPVKAFHIEFITDINEPCAFLEYADHSVTSKACAGLNGMRLGGKVVTAVFATPEAELEHVGKLPFYGIPEHVKPLLEKPTAVLKLKNVLDPEALLSLSESELEEILEDIRLECSRFGTLKSVNVAKPTNTFGDMEEYEVKNKNASTDGHHLESENRSHITEQLGDSINELEEHDRSEPLGALNELESNDQTVEGNSGGDSAGISKLLGKSVEPDDSGIAKVVADSLPDEIVFDKLMKDEICTPPSNDENISVKEPSSQETSGGFTGESANQQNSSVNELEINDKVAGSISVRKIKMENKPFIEEELKLEENNAKNVSSVELDTGERKELNAPDGDNKKDISIDHNDVFEPGSIFVEYRRAEAACMAAHCLQGRLFDGRVVTVGYVCHDLYQKRFRRSEK